MPRRLQVVRGAYYHLMNRGHNREVLFRDDDDYRSFLNLLSRYQGRFTQRLYHYCLMPNHFHLLAGCETAKGLSAWMAGLLRSSLPTGRASTHHGDGVPSARHRL